MANRIHFKIPFIERIANNVSLKEKVRDFAPQPVNTKDNVTMQIDTVVYFQITDPKLYTYGVENPINAIETLTATTLRNIIGELELDETLTSRDLINNKMCLILDEATSGLDNESEAIVQKAMDNLMKDRTVFIIAHRLSTIKNADRIAVINEGELVELGSNEELMQIENGQYKALYEMQFKKQEV